MISIIIINRDLLTWPKAMVAEIERYTAPNEVIILDNASTYEPLLEWYDTKPCTIVRLEKNLGHFAPWKSGLVDLLETDYFVVTDPDLDLSGTPVATLEFLMYKLNERPWLNKVGLSLEVEGVPEGSPYYQHVNTYERSLWVNALNGLYMAPIDTTFAMQKKNNSRYILGGARALRPYVAKHIPWYLTWDEILADEEFVYYLDRADHSCSYKDFIGYNKRKH